MTEARQLPVDPQDDGIRLDRWFKRHVPELAFGAVARLARTGQIRVDGKRVEPGDRVAAGQVVRVPPAEPPAAPPPEKRALSAEDTALAQSLVIHRDAHALVLNKPPGLATQGGTGTHAHVDRLLDALLFDAPGRPKLVHRLDKDTSGVLLLARSARAAAHFSRAFAGRTARKVYWALAIGVPDLEDGLIDLALAKQPGTGGEKMHADPQGQSARTRFRRIDRAGGRAAWLEFQPLTGRTHQIRAHAAAIGHPIVGDGKYGGAEAFLTGAISRKLHLHARRLVIEHPDGGMLDIRAEPPPHFLESLKQLGFDPGAGDLPLDDPPEPARAGHRRRSASASRARRGERRSRSRG